MNEQAQTKLEKIQRGITELFKPGQVVEVRTRTKYGWRGSYFDDFERMAAAIKNLDEEPGITAVYYVLNPIKRSILEDSTRDIVLNPESEIFTILHGCKQHLTGNDDIERLRWMFIDVDTVRAAGCEHESSTKAEKQHSKAVTDSLVAYLVDGRGWPQPVRCNSGNGWHVLFPIKLENSKENAELLASCARALAHRFDCDSCTIDAGVFNAARLTRAYGTSTRKGTHTEDRPHRMNRLISAPDSNSAEIVTLEALELLASEAPQQQHSGTSSRRSRPQLDPDFDPQDFFDFYDIAIENEFEKGGKTFYVTDECVIAERRHTGSVLTAFILGETFGYHCFSDDCAGQTIGDVLRLLTERTGERYPDPIFGEAEIEGIDIDFVDIDFETGAAGNQVSREAATPGSEEASASQNLLPTMSFIAVPSEVGVTGASSAETSPGVPMPEILLRSHADLVVKLAALILREPKEAFPDFCIWRQRLSKVVEIKAWPSDYLPLLKAIVAFEAKRQMLPSKTELLDSHPDDSQLSETIQGIPDIQADLTLDYVAQKIIERAKFLDEGRTAKKYLEKLHKSRDVLKARAYVKQRWQDGITSIERRGNSGSVQDNTADIYERFRKMQTGHSSNPLHFATGFGTIDETINAEQERCFAIIGPPNNFKTSVLLSVVYNLARQGKAVLLVTGEHETGHLEEYMAMLHAHHMRHMFNIPSYKDWKEGKASANDLQNLRQVLDDMNGLLTCPGPIVIKHINEFHNDFDEILIYMDNSHTKYQWTTLVLDPFDSLLLTTPSEQKFFKSGELIQRLFDLKTSYHGGEGLILMTSLQMKKACKMAVEKLQQNYQSSLSDFENVLDASNIGTYSAAVEKFDMLWGVAARNKNGTQGVLTCARVRYGKPFDAFWFAVDPDSHYCFEKAKSAARRNELELEYVNPGGGV